MERPVVHGPMGCGQKKKKKLSVSVVVPPVPVRVPSQRPLAPRVSSVTSVFNDKGYKKWREWQTISDNFR